MDAGMPQGVWTSPMQVGSWLVENGPHPTQDQEDTATKHKQGHDATPRRQRRCGGSYAAEAPSNAQAEDIVYITAGPTTLGTASCTLRLGRSVP